MTDPVSRDHAPPYRQEAIEHHRLRPAGSGSRSPMAHHSGLVAFWALLVALAMAAAASMLIRIGEYASGPARFSNEGQTLLAVLPEAAGPRLQRGEPLEVQVGARGRLEIQGPRLQVQPVDEATAARLLGAGGESDLPASTGLLLVRAPLPTPRPGLGSGWARVRISDQPLLLILLTGIASPSGSG
jgi:hypothetical protein